jgi:hypothetical protein
MGQGKVSQIRTDLESRAALVSVCLLVSLLEGSIVKEVIRQIRSGLVGG